MIDAKLKEALMKKLISQQRSKRLAGSLFKDYQPFRGFRTGQKRKHFVNPPSTPRQIPSYG